MCELLKLVYSGIRTRTQPAGWDSYSYSNTLQRFEYEYDAKTKEVGNDDAFAPYEPSRLGHSSLTPTAYSLHLTSRSAQTGSAEVSIQLLLDTAKTMRRRYHPYMTCQPFLSSSPFGTQGCHLVGIPKLGISLRAY